MKRLVLTALAAGAVALVTVVVVRKLNEALEYLGESDSDNPFLEEDEDLPPGVEGFRPTAPETWIPANLPDDVKEKLDEALVKFPEGWVKRLRPTRKGDAL